MNVQYRTHGYSVMVGFKLRSNWLGSLFFLLCTTLYNPSWVLPFIHQNIYGSAAVWLTLCRAHIRDIDTNESVPALKCLRTEGAAYSPTSPTMEWGQSADTPFQHTHRLRLSEVEICLILMEEPCQLPGRVCLHHAWTASMDLLVLGWHWCYHSQLHFTYIGILNCHFKKSSEITLWWQVNMTGY